MAKPNSPRIDELKLTRVPGTERWRVLYEDGELREYATIRLAASAIALVVVSTDDLDAEDLRYREPDDEDEAYFRYLNDPARPRLRR